MGWTNYIIVPKLKLIVEVNRGINESNNYQNKALDYLTDEERLFDVDEEQNIGDRSIKNLSVKDLTLLFSMYEQSSKISDMETDRFLLYWLESKGIKYEIKSEFQINENNYLEKYKEDGYVILRMFEE